MSFVGLLFGLIEVCVWVLCKGCNVMWIVVEVLWEGEVGLMVIFVFMGVIDSVVVFDE